MLVSLLPTHILQAALPEDLQGFDWSLLYSLSRDGPSFQTFYECAKGHVSTLVTVSTSSGTCFGAYTSDEWSASAKYFGTDDCFVFRAGGGGFEKFGCTGANKFYQLANEVRAAASRGCPCVPGHRMLAKSLLLGAPLSPASLPVYAFPVFCRIHWPSAVAAVRRCTSTASSSAAAPASARPLICRR